MGNSNAMEMIGFKQCLGQVFAWKLKIDAFVSDRHMQIRAFMRDTYGPNRKAEFKDNPEIIHYLDTWHTAKSKQFYYLLMFTLAIKVILKIICAEIFISGNRTRG